MNSVSRGLIETCVHRDKKGEVEQLKQIAYRWAVQRSIWIFGVRKWVGEIIPAAAGYGG